MPAAADAARPRVAVVGAGITGLAAAHRIAERLPSAELCVFEGSDSAGGVLQTQRRDGFLIERSADNFLTRDPWALDLCRRVGIADDLLPTEQSRRRALVVHRGRVVPAPDGFVVMAPKRVGPMLASTLLSWRGKLRLLAEPFVAKRTGDGDESVASFAKRRLGAEVYERLVQPLLAGIYTADPEKLSLRATMPQFVEQERRHGSLLRAAIAERRRQPATEPQESGARYGLFLAPRGGWPSSSTRLPGSCPTGRSPYRRRSSPSGATVRDGRCLGPAAPNGDASTP